MPLAPHRTRRLLLRALFPLLSGAALAACADDRPPPRTSFPALRYGFLTPLRLNVASVEIRDEAPQAPAPLLPPAVQASAVLRQLAEDRLVVSGSSGTAVFVIEQASIAQFRGGLAGALAVRLDVLTPDGNRAGFAEARVSRQYQGSMGDPRGAAYTLLDRMMDDMNVELEFQVRASLRDWLQRTAPNAPAPAAVQQQDLAPPPAAAPATPKPPDAKPEPDESPGVDL